MRYIIDSIMSKEEDEMFALLIVEDSSTYTVKEQSRYGFAEAF